MAKAALRNISTGRARRFCQMLERESAGRQVQWWTSIATVARRLGLSDDEAIMLADGNC